MDGKLVLLGAFIGLIIRKNWPTIEKFLLNQSRCSSNQIK